jgi:uncharacterized membrane protein
MTLLKDVSPSRLDPTPGSVVAARAVDMSGTRLAERGAWTLVWFGVLAGGLSLWHLWWYGPLAAGAAPFLVAAALGGMATCWFVTSPRSRAFQYTTLAIAVVSVALPAGIAVATRPFYDTDAAALDQGAARTLLRGSDPYTASLAGVRRLLSVPDRYWTYTIDGGHITHVSYPAGSFLFEVPAMALGLTHGVVDWVDLVAWLATGVLVFALLPASLRWLGVLLLLTPLLVDMGTDATFLPFLVLAVWRWDRYGAPDAGVAGWIGPLALGVACATKQTSWFCLPFLATGVAFEAQRAGRAATRILVRYLATVVAVFLVVNLPFVAWNPGAWARGTVTPLVDPLVADGQGLVTLATHGITGGVNLTALGIAGALALVTMLVAFAMWYPTLKRVWPMLLPVAFFFATRSLSTYMTDLVPVALAAATSVAAAPSATAALATRRTSRARVGRTRMTRVIITAVPALALVVAAVVAFSSAPLELAVRSVTTSNAGRTLDTVTTWVRNDTGSTVAPHFMVNAGNNPNGFLVPVGGRPVILGPHGAATVTLTAPGDTVAPQPGARWLIEAYTLRPKALSTSALVVWHQPSPTP